MDLEETAAAFDACAGELRAMTYEMKCRETARAFAQNARLYNEDELLERLDQADGEVAKLRERLDAVKAWRDALVDELARRGVRP